jgi:hypothetical protein
MMKEKNLGEKKTNDEIRNFHTKDEMNDAGSRTFQSKNFINLYLI